MQNEWSERTPGGFLMFILSSNALFCQLITTENYLGNYVNSIASQVL